MYLDTTQKSVQVQVHSTSPRDLNSCSPFPLHNSSTMRHDGIEERLAREKNTRITYQQNSWFLSAPTKHWYYYSKYIFAYLWMGGLRRDTPENRKNYASYLIFPNFHFGQCPSFLWPPRGRSSPSCVFFLRFLLSYKSCAPMRSRRRWYHSMKQPIIFPCGYRVTGIHRRRFHDEIVVWSLDIFD